ncbi:MAG: cation transporter, partial [Treponema sp.]|nr:cation transporter [Treponema sp.]
MSEKATISIAGMSCAACAQAVEKALKAMAGVESAAVNFASEKAAVAYDPQKVTMTGLYAAIEQAGYTVIKTAKNPQVDTDKLRKERESKILWYKFIVAAVFGFPLLYICMAPMIPRIPLFVPAFIHPDISPLNFAIAQIILTFPIVIAGYKFYTVGFGAFFRGRANMDSLIAIGTSAAIVYSTFSVWQI